MHYRFNQLSRGVRHSLPNRTRLKLPRAHRNAELMERLEAAISAIEYVRTVNHNAKTGSITIEHAENPAIFEALASVIERLAPAALYDMSGSRAGEEEVSILASLIGRSFQGANRYITGYTDNQIDLRTILPLALAGLGLHRASAIEGWWREIPPYLFFYWAYDSFLRFHLYRIPEQKQNGSLLLAERN